VAACGHRLQQRENHPALANRRAWALLGPADRLADGRNRQAFCAALETQAAWSALVRGRTGAAAGIPYFQQRQQ